MNPFSDDPIGRHLDARARTIDLPRTDVGAIAERADRRRRRRQRTTAGMAGVTLVAGAAFAFVLTGDEDETRTPVATQPNPVAESPLEWTTVEPAVGLAWSSQFGASTVVDGVSYRLSTAPGPARDISDPISYANWSLYRSADGAEWEAVDLPAQLYASAVASNGSQLYAVGTGPAGGDQVPFRLTVSSDGGDTWSDPTDLAPELTALKAEFGSEVLVNDPVVATHGDTTVVAVSVQAVPDLSARVHGIDLDGGWEVGPEGVRVYGQSRCAEDGGPCPAPPVIANLTWDQVGLPPELLDLVVPRLHLFATGPDGGFEPVAGPEGVSTSPPLLVADDAGFSLLFPQTAALDGDTALRARGLGDVGPTLRFTSTDGRSWAPAADLPLFVNGAGRVGDTTMVSGWNAMNGDTMVASLDGSGTGAAIDPVSYIDIDGSRPGIGVMHTDFGPLGWAALVADHGTDGVPVGQWVVHSDPSGTTVSVVEIPEELWNAGITGITVTADAISVRFTPATDGDPTTVDPQVVWVGTPRG